MFILKIAGRILLLFAVPVMLGICEVSCGGPSGEVSIDIEEKDASAAESGGEVPGNESYDIGARVAELAEKCKDNPELLDAAIYADFYGITVDESVERFRINDAVGGLDEALETAEPETFAGLWIQHTPEYRIVIAFTEGGEEAVAKYVSEEIIDYVEIRTVTYSMAEMWEARNTVEVFLKSEGTPFDSGIYVVDNRVEISVTDRTAIDEAVNEGKLTIPGCVLITVVEGLATPD